MQQPQERWREDGYALVRAWFAREATWVPVAKARAVAAVERQWQSSRHHAHEAVLKQ